MEPSTRQRKFQEHRLRLNYQSNRVTWIINSAVSPDCKLRQWLRQFFRVEVCTN